MGDYEDMMAGLAAGRANAIEDGDAKELARINALQAQAVKEKKAAEKTTPK